MHQDRIRCPQLRDRIVDAETAAAHIKDGMTVGMSGFTKAGEAKAVPLALAKRAKTDPLKITLITGASLGHHMDQQLTEAGVLARRMPFQADPALRKAINRGDVMFIDQHLSETVEQLRAEQIHSVDVAIIEATAITENGGIVPTTSVGNSASFSILAEKVIIELNLSADPLWEGVHDIFIPTRRPARTPIPLVATDSRIGMPYIPIPPEKIVGIVLTNEPDSYSEILPPDEGTKAISDHLIRFFLSEVKKGHLTNELLPLQAGIGTIANSVMHGLIDSPFYNLKMYSEVLQDSTIQLFDSGKLLFASAAAVTLSEPVHKAFMENFETYRSKIVLRPQEVSNHPEVVRRLGIIGINTALEFDIYGNVNSTHVGGTHMMNGIGGSGDFARNGYLSIFVTKSLAKDGAISSVVPMVSHVDHTEHDVDILVTDQGLADLRGLAPRERAQTIIANCVHPDYREALLDYHERAKARGGHTPHILEEAVSWHTAFRDHKDMRKAFS
ncbi:MAG: acetyl-CoA hydrolase/transferase family protein [Rhodobacteraceae bacterium]|nr:acetyl-CoA hydrolase/transferase family protein [Paracoccaceae bacterium]